MRRVVGLLAVGADHAHEALGDRHDERRREEVRLDPDRLPEGKLHRGRGCGNCFNSAYLDRTGLYEILPIDDAVKDQIVAHASASAIKRSAIERGFTTLRMDGAVKVARGMTTVEEVLRVTQMDVL